MNARAEPAGEAQRYVLDGMHRAGWSEWHIVAEGVTLVWERVLGDAWFTGVSKAR